MCINGVACEAGVRAELRVDQLDRRLLFIIYGENIPLLGGRWYFS